MSDSLELNLFKALRDYFAEASLPTNLIVPEPERPFHTLIVRLGDLGEDNRALNFELSVPPGVTDPETRTFLLQIFVAIDHQVGQTRDDDVLWLTGQLNTRLPVGAFGLMQDSRTTYYKQSMVMDGAVAIESQVRLVDLQMGMMIHMLNTFADLITSVTQGADAPKALGQHPLGKIYAMAG